MELTDEVKQALRIVAGLDYRPMSYNELRAATDLAHRYMQWHEIDPRVAVRLVAYADGSHRTPFYWHIRNFINEALERSSRVLR